MGRPPSTTRPVGLFCGLAVVDVIQLVQAPPGPDDKIIALDQLIAAGGPATNAAEGREGDGGVGGRATGGDELIQSDDLVVGSGRRLDELDDIDDGQAAEQADGAGGRSESIHSPIRPRGTTEEPARRAGRHAGR